MKRDVSYIESKSKMKDTNSTISVTVLIMNRLNSRIKKQTLLRRELFYFSDFKLLIFYRGIDAEQTTR